LLAILVATAYNLQNDEGQHIKDKIMTRQQQEEKPSGAHAGAEKRREGRPPTSADIARLANVSRATVSFVLNDVCDNRVSEETQARVRKIAEDLGYVPHAIARSLRAGQNNLILMPLFDWPYNLDSLAFLQELGSQLEQRGYTTLLQTGRGKTMPDAARAWASLRPAGVILPGEQVTRETLAILSSAGVRTVVAFGNTISELVPTILTDFTAVGRCAVRHLAARGYRRVAVVVPRDPRIQSVGLQRLQGAEEAGRETGLEVERVDLAYDWAEALQLVAGWKDGPRPEGVFTYNDEYGMLLMRALLDSGFALPGEMALVGCDDLPLCTLLRPQLTSIQISPGLTAHTAATFLDRRIHDKENAPLASILISPQLIARASSLASSSPQPSEE
jgi:DNA-binding LacI/PurR family transcriptional regulator